MAARSMAALVALALLGSAMLAGCAQGGGGESADITFLEFFDPKCPFCAEMEPIVEDLEAEYADRLAGWEIIDITTDEGRQKVEDYGVFLTPTFVILDADGEEMDRVTGATTKENMVDFIERAIADASGEPTGPRPEIEGEGSELTTP
ncbi:MAG: hypothetical protein Kow0056_07800 [Coriobacteriia bacterium]